MAIGTTTPRDKLDQLLAFARRTLRYWWLVAIITVVGGALSVLVAFVTKPKYMSEARLFYNERINSSLLRGRDVIMQTKNLGNRYREMLLARSNLTKVITELDLFPDIVAEEGIDAAIEELEELIKFRIRGTGMFHIQSMSADPELSQAMTQMLTNLLIEEDRRIRRESASATKNFLLEEKAKVNQELNRRMKALAAFLADHPEFAEDSISGPQAATGAGVRAAAQGKNQEAPIPNAENMDPRLLALERQRRRLRARLAAPDKVDRKPVESPEIREAKEAVRETKRDLEQAKNRLESLRAQGFKPAHPDVVRAKARVREARKRLARAEAAVPPAPPKPPPIDRNELKRELQKVERQIASTKSDLRKGTGKDVEVEEPKEEEEPDNWVVALETEFARLTQGVEEARRRVNKLDTSLSNAEITASQQMAEEGAVLTIIDSANLPSRPQGKGRIFLVAAGLFAFIVLGSMLALALALVDDRIYTAGDLEQLGIAPVMVVIPKPPKQKKRSRRG